MKFFVADNMVTASKLFNIILEISHFSCCRFQGVNDMISQIVGQGRQEQSPCPTIFITNFGHILLQKLKVRIVKYK